MKVKFEVPYNGDSELVQSYIKNKDYVTMVYGRAEDGYPQGRKTKNSKVITLDDIFEQTKILMKHGIKFNYLLNGNCHSNREFDKKYRNKFVSFVKKLHKNGISIVTISNLYLIEIVANEVPSIDIFVSAILEVDCLARLEQLSQFGVKYVCLSKTLLKDFNGLRNIITGFDARIEPVLLVNDPCIHHCAYTQYHNNMLSHLTSDGTSCVSYCRLHCTKNLLNDTKKIISASFVRPEDVSIYHNMGFGLFKICDRKQKTEWILNALNSYIEGNYSGNLSDIMAPWSRHGGAYDIPLELTLKDFTTTGIDALRDYLRFSPFIDNKKMDGYLKFWLDNKPNGCRNENCDTCGYCGKIATDVLNMDPIKRRILVKNINLALIYSMNI